MRTASMGIIVALTFLRLGVGAKPVASPLQTLLGYAGTWIRRLLVDSFSLLLGLPHSFRLITRRDTRRSPPFVMRLVLFMSLPSMNVLAALAALKPSTDMDVYETVVRFISPLPVLRDTLRVWLSEVSDSAIAEMGENVLLVLHPEHICSAVAGKPQESNDQHVFLPLLRTPLAGPTDHSLPVVWVGHICPRWVQTWQLGALPPVPCGLEDVIAGAFPQAAGFCIALPSLPSPVSAFFRPDAMPLKCLRALCAWLDRALKALLVVLRQAQSGVPALVRFPISAESLQPLSGWLLSLAELDAGSLRPSCFTVEFTS